jgi:hypothetical protein
LHISAEKLSIIALATRLGFPIVSVSGSPSSGGYSVRKKIPIPGKGGWDYLAVDESARRLYVSHGTEVEILNLDTGERAKTMALDPQTHQLFLSTAENGQFEVLVVGK